MKSLRMSSIVFSATVTLGLVLVASSACTRGGPTERGEVRIEPVGTANLQLGAMIAAPANGESGSVSAAHKAANDACPSGMVLIEGEYCPEVEHKCLEWMDPPSSRYAHFRCKRYEKSATCKGPKVHRRYCIDATERTESDTRLPRHFMSWTS